MYSKSGGTSGLIKVISGLLATLLLTPMLIFTALPNTVFGYNSATNQGIADFTSSAQRLTNAYQNIELKKQSALDRLVNTILPGFSDYDDYQVTDGSGGMNQNWLIAIGSVRYKQDLNVMDDDALEDLLYGKLAYSASVTDRVLNISVWDLTPEAYMDRLGFTQEEKDWAALLYSVMAEEQRVMVGDTDGSGYYGTDYGDITFTNAETPVVYYNQTDARWGNKSYGKTSTIGRDGKNLVEALQQGKLVIAIMSKGHFTNSGHFIVLRGVTEDGKILVADPASVKKSNKEWDLRIITGEASRKVGSVCSSWRRVIWMNETYYIPTNFTDAGRVMGLFEIRNMIEAVLLTLPVLYFCVVLLPLSLTPKIMVTLTIIVPVGGFGLIGISDDSLTRWLGCWWRWRKNRRLIFYRGECKT